MILALQKSLGRKVNREVLMAILAMLMIDWVTFKEQSNTTSYNLALPKELGKDEGTEILMAILAMPTRVGKIFITNTLTLPKN